MKKIVFLAALFACATAVAQNPIVPPGVYLADPEGHQWKDGKLYLYVSRDENPDYYCSNRYDLISTSDLKKWTITPNVFASKGPNDEVPYSDGMLYASDAAYKNGKYYLYYSMNDAIDEGVAVADSPLGPFKNGQPMKGAKGIDPAVFVDDDGQAYFYWGQFAAKGAKLKENMTEIDLSTITDSLITEKNEYFHEGASMRKRNGIYYLVYSHLRRGRPTCIGYSTSTSPLGPFKYGGVIVDNMGCDPETWNNHGSICEFNGQWYVVYHRTTNGSRSLRKVCMEPIAFDENGRISEVQMTSQGTGAPFKACDKIDAYRACDLRGNVRIQSVAADKDVLGGIQAGNQASYRYIDFGEGVDSFTVTVTPKAGGKLVVALDNLWSPLAGAVEIPASESGKPQTLTIPINPIKGVHEVIFLFEGDKNADELFTVESFSFAKK